MVQSLNSKADVVEKAVYHHGLSTYGKLMVGNKAFEFYGDNVNHYLQIPWDEVDKIIASIYRKGKCIPRYAIQTKDGRMYIFSSREPKKVLRACRNYVDPQNIVRSLTFFQVLKRNIKRVIKRDK
ncbi:DUF956 family protein [Ligilactobacillus sp. LYQ135]